MFGSIPKFKFTHISISCGDGKRMGRRGRDKSQIHYEILRAVKNGTHLQSRIAQTARLCHSDLKHNLKALVDAGLLMLGELSSYGAEKVFLTGKGAEFVQQGILTNEKHDA